MANLERSSGNSRSLTLLLLAVVVPPSVMLIWLGVRLLEQDRSYLAQREFERRQSILQSHLNSLERSLAEVERHLDDGALPAGSVRLRIATDRVEAEPADRVLWLPIPRIARTADASYFSDAERDEFRGALANAMSKYERLRESSESEVRAGSLLRIARVHWRQRRWDEALRALQALAAVSDVAIEGAPADLQARRASCAILAESGRAEELASAIRALETDFLAGRWLVDEATWKLTAADIERWSGRTISIDPGRRMFSAVADTLWRTRIGEAASPRNRRVVELDGVAVTVLSRAQGSQLVAVAISPAVVDRWAHDAMARAPHGAALSLLSPSGFVIAGPAARDGSSDLRAQPAETGLPWAIALAGDDSSPISRELAGRRRLLLLGLAAILLLVIGGSYLLWRVVHRELAIATLQTEFVSAVSHEFRTPLTALRHVTELLEESDDMPRERRKTFYEALGRNTERLHRLVESLLDFSRMESGRKPYTLERVDAGALAADVVSEFQREVETRGYRVALDIASGRSVEVRADASALVNALWNLLDNAVKYSPDRKAIYVTVAAQHNGVAISVRDEGLGIAPHERQMIFGRFVRGANARLHGIKGTGLGLAMVAHIVRAHGGVVEVESQEGRGSTFTLLLPQLL